MYLSSEKMADALVDSADVIELAIFAHTHMDETHLLRNDGQSGKSVAVRWSRRSRRSTEIIHPSPLPRSIHHRPRSRITKSSPRSNQTGVDAAWSEEYDFARSYHEAEFTSSSVSQLIVGFAADPGAKTQASQNYIQDFSVGYLSPVLTMFWPEYVCTLSNHTQQAFKACVCPAPH